MTDFNFEGTGTALITPFDKSGAVDYKGLEKLLISQIEGQVDYFVVFGTTGEYPTLSIEEKKKILKHIISISNNQLPIVLGIGGNDTKQVVSKVRKINKDRQIKAILSVSPYYNKPTQEGIYCHFKEIANNTDLPIILYNVPSRTASHIDAKTILRLASDFKNIKAVKEASDDFYHFNEILLNKPKGFHFILGDDTYTVPMIALGASGVISVISNAYPKEFSRMIRFALSGNFKTAKNLHFALFNLMTTIFDEGNPAGVKAILCIKGICDDKVRLPLTSATKTLQEKLEILMEDFENKI